MNEKFENISVFNHDSLATYRCCPSNFLNYICSTSKIFFLNIKKIIFIEVSTLHPLQTFKMNSSVYLNLHFNN